MNRRFPIDILQTSLDPDEHIRFCQPAWQKYALTGQIQAMKRTVSHKADSKLTTHIENAVCRALAEGVVTRDLGGACTTVEVGDYLARAVLSSPVEAL